MCLDFYIWFSVFSYHTMTLTLAHTFVSTIHVYSLFTITVHLLELFFTLTSGYVF